MKELIESILPGAVEDPDNLDLSKVNFIGAKAENAVFDNAVMNNTSFIGPDLRFSIFDRVKSENTHFLSGKFDGAVFRDSHFYRPNFIEPVLGKIDLSRTVLHLAFFLKADFKGYDFTN